MNSNYKGLDITLGQGEEAYGGILIRSIEAIGTGKFVCGPCKSVDHILELCKATSIKVLVDQQVLSVEL